jgi:hypothetical protein
MDKLSPIALDQDWRYFPTEDMDTAYGASLLDESSWGVLARIEDFPRDVVQFYRELHLRHVFDLEPIADQCLRFHLMVDEAPRGTQFYVNGWHVGTMGDSPLVSDVTDYVTLEGNVLLLKLTSERGTFKWLRLQPVPCDPG